MDSELLVYATLVHSMRYLQKRYFRSREKDVLIRSKETEKEVDRVTEQIIKNATKEAPNG